jgi:hypothetical protein
MALHRYDATVRALQELDSLAAVRVALADPPWWEDTPNGVLEPLAPEYLDALYDGITRKPTAMDAYAVGVFILRGHGVWVDVESPNRQPLPAEAAALNAAVNGLHWTIAAALTNRPPGGVVVPREVFETSSPLAPRGVVRMLLETDAAPAAKRLFAALRWTPATHRRWDDAGVAFTLLCIARRTPALPRELWLLLLEFAAMDGLCKIQ